MIKIYKIAVLKIIIQMVLKILKKERESKAKTYKTRIFTIKRKTKNYLKMTIRMKIITNMKLI